MTKEISKKEKTEVAIAPTTFNDGDIESKDLSLPMICVAQGNSDITKMGKAKPSDIYETLNKTILGDQKAPLQFIPIKYFKTWVHIEMVKSSPEFRSIEPYNVSNATKYQFEEVKDGVTFRHYETLNFYVLLKKELADGTAFPYLLSFRSSNKKKGRALINHMARARALVPPQPLCSMVFSLSTVLTTKDKNSWFIFDVAALEKTSDKDKEKCLEWLNTLNAIAPKIDEMALKNEISQDISDVTPPVKTGEVSKEARY